MRIRPGDAGMRIAPQCIDEDPHGTACEPPPDHPDARGTSTRSPRAPTSRERGPPPSPSPSPCPPPPFRLHAHDGADLLDQPGALHRAQRPTGHSPLPRRRRVLSGEARRWATDSRAGARGPGNRSPGARPGAEGRHTTAAGGGRGLCRRADTVPALAAWTRSGYDQAARRARARGLRRAESRVPRRRPANQAARARILHLRSGSAG